MNRLLSLDVLRAVAVLLTLACHGPWEGWSGAWMGVDLFFVLSGFLVGGLLLRQPTTWGEFVIRRGWKIYPAFFAFIGFSVFMVLASGGQLDARGLIGEITFTQNYFGRLWPHTWTLGVEEHFYLLLPLIVRRPLVLAAVCVLSPLMRASVVFDSDVHWCATHLRLDALCFGVLLQHAYRGGVLDWCRRFRLTLFTLGVSLWLMPFAVQRDGWMFAYGLTLVYLGAGLIVISAVIGPFPTNAVTTGLGRIGYYSYSIYLWHYTVRYWGPQVDALSYMVLSIAVGILMARLIEHPVLALRDRAWRLCPMPALGAYELSGASR